MNLTTVKDRLSHIPKKDHQSIGRLLVHFVDTMGTASPRVSFYNTEEETVRAVAEVHQEVFKIDRGLYGLMLAFPGVMDWSRQLGVATLLGNKPDGAPSLLDLKQETMLVEHLAHAIPITRRLKLFGALRKKKVNNARTRKMILRSILNDPDLEWHALKYKEKLNVALTHAWGKRRASIIKSILEKAFKTTKEQSILSDLMYRYVAKENNPVDEILFILGSTELINEKLKAYHEANENFDALKHLPPEVAEGKRSVYHPDRTSAEVLELTKSKLTERQKMQMQASAEKKDVKVEWDAKKQDAVSLYVYAYERGMNTEIRDALKSKALAVAENLPVKFSDISIIVDCSKSMVGGSKQKNRPIAVALAMKDVLEASVGDGKSVVHYAGGAPPDESEPLFTPAGDTSLAVDLVEAIAGEPEAVFVITDGYENTPAGRFAEVVDHLRKMNIETPIYQLTPTFSAEAFGTRQLSEEVMVLPVSQNTKSLGLGMIKMMLEGDLLRGVLAIVEMTMPKLLEVQND